MTDHPATTPSGSLALLGHQSFDLDDPKQRGLWYLANLRLIAQAVNAPITADRIALDATVIPAWTDPREFASVVAWGLRCGRWEKFFPRQVELLDAILEYRLGKPLAEAAYDAYRGIQALVTFVGDRAYRTCDVRRIEESLGRPAASAFFSVGGNATFWSPYGETARYERFRDAWIEASRRLARPDEDQPQLDSIRGEL